MSDDILIQLFCLNLLMVFFGSLLYFVGTEALKRAVAPSKTKNKVNPFF